jgi:hypothetical protein
MQTKNREGGILGHVICCRSRAEQDSDYREYSGFGVFPFVVNRTWDVPTGYFEDISTSIRVSDSGVLVAVNSTDGIYSLDEGDESTSFIRVIPERGVTTGVCGDYSLLDVFGDSKSSHLCTVASSASGPRTSLSVRGPTFAADTPIDGDLGPVCAISHWGSQIVLGHTVGKISVWSFEGVFSGSFTVSDSPLSHIEADTDFLYILSEDGTLKIFQLLDILEASSGDLTPYLTTRVGTYSVRRLIIPWRSATGGYPGTHVLGLTRENDLIRIPLLGGEEIELLFSSISDAVFGPFDNGPLITVRGDIVSVHQQGGGYKSYSETRVEGQVVSVAVSIDDPKVWILCADEDRQLSVHSWSLRGDPDSQNIRSN